MIAYNQLWLHNLLIRKQSEKAYRENCITSLELDHIKNKYPVLFYSPNLFIRIGLFILTVVILFFSIGLIALLFASSFDKAVGVLAIFFGMLAYGLLEYMVRVKSHFRSGVEEALLWISAGAIFGGISYTTHAGSLANCLIVFVVSLYGSLRFGDWLMSVVLYLSLVGIAFFTCINLGPSAKAFVPFVVFAISMVVYQMIKRINPRRICLPYTGCKNAIAISALIGTYFSVNYLVVRELTVALFDVQLADNATIPFGWLFWAFTVIIPILYLLKGIQKKDLILIRVGLLLVAAIIFTIRYYYSIVNAEIIMTIVGFLLIGISYFLSRYLKVPKYGFTSQEKANDTEEGPSQLESLLQAETLTDQSISPDDVAKFGGGSFGGAGASGQY
jgi:hypothetical protein